MSKRHVEPKKAKFLIAGNTRDTEKVVYQDIKRILKAFEFASEIHFLVIESDSSDNTVKILEKCTRDFDNFKFHSFGDLVHKYPKRTQRLAYCRNFFLKKFRQEYQDMDYLVVADLDGINNIIDQKAVLSCWERDDWDVCTANQKGGYYDLWTLRHDKWCPGDVWQKHLFLRRYGVGNNINRLGVSMISIDIPADEPWIEVESAFGGLAVYRRDVMMDGEYVGLYSDGHEVCEHVALNQIIRKKGGRIFINPKMMNRKYYMRSHYMLLTIFELLVKYLSIGYAVISDKFCAAITGKNK